MLPNDDPNQCKLTHYATNRISISVLDDFSTRNSKATKLKIACSGAISRPGISRSSTMDGQINISRWLAVLAQTWPRDFDLYGRETKSSTVTPMPMRRCSEHKPIQVLVGRCGSGAGGGSSSRRRHLQEQVGIQPRRDNEPAEGELQFVHGIG